jgi:exonuclease III
MRGWMVTALHKISFTQKLLRNRLDRFTEDQKGRKKDEQYGIMDILKIATWNVRSLGNKEGELVTQLKEKNINIAVITETKKKLRGTTDVGNDMMIYSGVDQERRGSSSVCTLADSKWKEKKIKEYSFVNERMVTARFQVQRGYITELEYMHLKKEKEKIQNHFMKNYKRK